MKTLAECQENAWSIYTTALAGEVVPEAHRSAVNMVVVDTYTNAQPDPVDTTAEVEGLMAKAKAVAQKSVGPIVVAGVGLVAYFTGKGTDMTLVANIVAVAAGALGLWWVIEYLHKGKK